MKPDRPNIPPFSDRSDYRRLTTVGDVVTASTAQA